mmetsp:Transcript_18561/g.38674  ORF Transcript_18561/g.38674 Transcript_18561/m.38674 type:complete len:296 (+) Transcript_18561:656-1543(+)
MVQVPLSHLLKVLKLVVLVDGPTHVKHVRMDESAAVVFDDAWLSELPSLSTTVGQLFHKAWALVKGVSTGKLGGSPVPGLHLECVQTGLFGQQRDHNGLVGGRRQNLVSRHQQRIEKVLRPPVVPHVVKARVGRIGCVKQGASSVVLENNVVLLGGTILLVEPGKRIFVPDHVNVLEQEVVAELGNQVDAIDLGQHDSAVAFVSVFLGGLRGGVSKDGLAVKTGQPHRSDQLVGFQIRGKHQHVVECLQGLFSLSAGVADEIQEHLRVSKIANDYHDRVVLVVGRDGFSNGFEFL